jgi:ribosomal protein S18 acetylase RimI-like enzyme
MSELTTWYLEMRDRGDLCSKAGPAGFEVSTVAEPRPDLNLEFYRKVGGGWGWKRRLEWTEAQWLEYLGRPVLTTGVVSVDGQSVGYFELESQEDGDVEIVQLGLLPDYVGRGLGGALVTAALESAWSIPGTRRVWLHTCSRDHKNALGNYQRRGLVVYKTVGG